MTIDRQFSPEEQKKINVLFSTIFNLLGATAESGSHAVAAMMAATATLCAASEETDDFIIEQFKKCLLDARTRGATCQ